MLQSCKVSAGITTNLFIPAINVLQNAETSNKMEKISRLWKMHGSIEVTDANGNKVVWLWDYANDKARLKTQMTEDEIMASEKAKWMGVKSQLDAEKWNCL